MLYLHRALQLAPGALVGDERHELSSEFGILQVKKLGSHWGNMSLAYTLHL